MRCAYKGSQKVPESGKQPSLLGMILSGSVTDILLKSIPFLGLFAGRILSHVPFKDGEKSVSGRLRLLYVSCEFGSVGHSVQSVRHTYYYN